MRPTTLRVVSLKIRDVLGAKEFALEAGGKLTLLAGRNGSGKSTALAAVQAALTGGNLAKLARVGEEGEEVEPEVVLVLSGAGHETYRIERNGDKVRVRARVGDTAAFEDIPKPQAWLTSLFDPQGANPVRFLMASDKDRALLLLEALPLLFDRAALLKEMGIEGDPLPPIPVGLHPLEEIGMIRDAVFDRRTAVNRDEKSATHTADQLRRSIPATLPEDPAAAIKALDADVTKLADELAAGEETAVFQERAAITAAEAGANVEDEKIAAAFKAFAAMQRSVHEKLASDWRAKVEREIAEDLAGVEARIGDRKTADEERLREIDETTASERRLAAAVKGDADRALAALRNTVNAKREQLAVLREQEKTAASAQTLDAQAARFEKDAERLVAESERLTASLDTLDAYRRRMAENLPIDGLSIEGKVIRVHGIPFDQLNTSQKVDLAVQVACLRAKGQRLPVVFVDGAEALDHEHFELLVARLREAGVQAFLGRVEDTDLQVVTDEAQVKAAGGARARTKGPR